MSSHHFVKEGQEPALIVANGEMCSYTLLTSLLEWSPFVVALDGAYDNLQKLQIEADIVIGDFDSLQNIEEISSSKLIQVIDQEKTDLEKAIDHLISTGYDHINIVGATGNRLDHTLNNFAVLAKYESIKIVIYNDYSKAFLLNRSFNKYYEAGQSLSLIPLPEAHGIATTNLVYALNDESLSYGGRSGTSNEVVSAGTVSISYSSGKLILIENIGKNK